MKCSLAHGDDPEEASRPVGAHSRCGLRAHPPRHKLSLGAVLAAVGGHACALRAELGGREGGAREQR